MPPTRLQLLNPYRLGLERRNRRNYSVHQRPTGKTANERLYEEELMKLLQLVLLTYCLNPLSKDDEDFIVILVVLYLIELDEIQEPKLTTPDAIPPLLNNFNSFTEQQFSHYFGFRKEQAIILYEALNFPEELIIGSDHHKFKVNSIHCFLILYFDYIPHLPDKP